MPTVNEEKKIVDRRQAWLDKKGMTIREFADSLKLDYNCVFRWIHEARSPARLYRERLLSIYRDFPLK